MLIARTAVTTLQLTPTLLADGRPASCGECLRVRRLLAGGEALSRRSCGVRSARSSAARVINLYGPTETTTFSA